jgi:hypothetical protein
MLPVPSAGQPVLIDDRDSGDFVYERTPPQHIHSSGSHAFFWSDVGRVGRTSARWDLSHPPGGEGPTTVVTPGASIPTARTLGILVLAAAMLWIGWSTLQRS